MIISYNRRMRWDEVSIYHNYFISTFQKKKFLYSKRIDSKFIRRFKFYSLRKIPRW